MPRLRVHWLVPLLLTSFLVIHPQRLVALDYENCVIVMFERDVMTLPEGLSQCSLDSASVSLPTIESILASNGASIVAKLDPDFELADTLELVDGRRTAGIHRAVWDGTNSKGDRVASGVYFCKLTAGSFTATKKMVMLK